jgi:hypothetical protein
MKKWIALFALAFAGVGLFPDTGEAGPFRRRCRPQPVCQPVVVVCPPVAFPVTPIPIIPVEPPRAVVIEGETYVLVESGETDAKRDEVEPEVVGADTGGISTHDRFKGKARRVAKTTIFVSKEMPTPFDSVTALITSLPPDADMVALNIPHGPNSSRVDQEKKNVVVTAFLYAYSKETDNDYHVIIGDAPSVPVGVRRYMNVEVSGLPVTGTNANRDQLREVRNTFKTRFGLGNTGPNSYVKPNPPVPVRITGSLFYDVDHAPPEEFVGPKSHKPQTAWEIHPISKIEFLSPKKMK